VRDFFLRFLCPSLVSSDDTWITKQLPSMDSLLKIVEIFVEHWGRIARQNPARASGEDEAVIPPSEANGMSSRDSSNTPGSDNCRTPRKRAATEAPATMSPFSQGIGIYAPKSLPKSSHRRREIPHHGNGVQAEAIRPRSGSCALAKLQP
jgi:hypothetical protein